MKKNLYKYLMLVLLVLMPGLAMAQKTLVRGVVMDGSFDEPMYGVNVIWENKDGRTVGGLQTNFDGSFALSEVLRPGDRLVFSFVGYTKLTVPIEAGKSVYNVTLQEERVQLKEAVVTAERRQSTGMMNIAERDLTTSSKRIDMAELEDLAVADVTDALQGRVAGMDMVATSGAPGAGMSIRVRGTTTLNGSSEPLVVVDGFPYETTIQDDFDFATADENDYATMLNIAPDDIKEITVLKDAAATAIYGSRGANGVLLINTKRGTATKPTISYSFKGTISKPGDGIPVLSGEEYTTLIMDEMFNAGKVFAPTTFPELANDANNLYNYYNYGQSTDWYKEATQTGHAQDHSISISGGSKKAVYRASFNYYDEEGTVIGEGYQRLSARINVDYNVSEKFKFSASMSYTYSETDRNYVSALSSRSNVLSQAFNRAPNMGVFEFDQTGTLTDNYFTPSTDLSGNYWKNTTSSPYNPVAMAKEGFYKKRGNRIMPNLAVQWTPLQWLRYKLEVSFDVNNEKENAFVPQSATGRPWTESTVNAGRDKDNESFVMNTSNQLYFMPDLGEDHKLQAVINLRTYNARNKNVAIGVSNLPSISLVDPSNGGVVANSDLFGSSSSEVREVNLVGQIQYSAFDRYIMNLSAGYEGSSKFGDDNRFGFFPAVSARWRISSEPFLEDLVEKWNISDLSARFSWGQSGNSSSIKDYYAAQATYNTYAFKYLNQSGTYQNRLQLADLRWEKTGSINIGADLGLFDNRVVLHYEWYRKETNQLVVNNRPVPTSTGYSSVSYFNFAGMQNRGWELDGDFTIYRDKDWTVRLNANVARNENELDEDLETLGTWTGNVTGGNYPTLQLAGQPLGSFYGYIYEGVYHNADETIARDAKGAKIYTYNDKGEAEPVYMRFNYPTTDYLFQPGDAKYKDVNNDGNINEQDVVYLGNGMPLFTGGFGTTLKWKNLSLQTFFNFRYGNDVVNIAKANLEAMRGYNNQATSVLRRWRHEYTPEQVAAGEVPAGLLPRAVYGQGYNSLASSRYVEDGSFLRFKTATLSYSVPKDWMKQHLPFMTDLRVYFQMSNIYCWTSYTGMDPEVSISSASTPGYDTSVTPRPKQYILGLSVRF